MKAGGGMDITRREGESEFAYHRRLVYGKVVDRTLEDYDYSELAPLVYGRELSSDNTRRMMYGSRETLELLDSQKEQAVSDGGILDELEAKKLELQKERQKFFDQRREYNKKVSADARLERLEDRIVEAAGKLLETAPLNVDKYSGPELEYNDGEAVLIFSDWHYGMTTSNVWNSYNTDICRERVAYVVAKSIEKLKLHRPRALNVVLLGDLSQGGIHVSARVASEELVCDQIMNVAELVAQAIAKLSGYVSTTYVYATYGNHLRTIQNKKDNIHHDNMERLIPWWLKERFHASGLDDIIVVDESDNEFTLFDVCGYNILITHGDLDNVKTSPRLLHTLFAKKTGQSVDYILLGDKHHLSSFEEMGVEALLSRSLCGTDDYANEHRLFSMAGQTLLFFTPDVGRDATYDIRCK